MVLIKFRKTWLRQKFYGKRTTYKGQPFGSRDRLRPFAGVKKLERFKQREILIKKKSTANYPSKFINN
jgi:hypothetical protein